MSVESRPEPAVRPPLAPPVPHSPHHALTTRLTVWFVAAMAVVVALYYAVPSWNLGLWVTLGLSSCVASLVGVKLNAPPRRLPWYLLAAATFSLINGDTIYNILTDVFHQNEPFPSVADVSYLFTYPLAAAGLMIMIRMRSPRRDTTALVDALLLSGGLGLLIWVFTITPTVNEQSVPWFDSAVSIAYPLGDVLLLAVVMRLLTGGGIRGWSPVLLVLGVAGVMASDIAYALVRLYGTWQVGGPADLGWITFYVCWGAAALHPSMVEVTEPQESEGRLTAGRVIPLALAALVAPTVLFVEALQRNVKDAAVIAVFSAALFILVVARLTLQGKQQRFQESEAQSRVMVKELHNRAYRDALTGLGNRAMFQERSAEAFARARASGGVVCMLLIDLDNFKEVNDTLGHRAGDELLMNAAKRLEREVRPGDVPVRFGGDEFAVLLADGAKPEGAEALATRLVRVFSEPFQIWDTQAEVRGSIGVAASSDEPDTPESEAADVLLRNADLALYAAKADGKGIWTRYRRDLYETAMERVRLRTDLDTAIDEDQFFLLYQPIIDLRGGRERVAGFEALVRWQHPELGLLAPSHFIPLAEDTGQIIRLGEWILARAISDAARWNDGLTGAEARRVTVNVSAHQFMDDGLVDWIDTQLAKAGLPADQLILEITETAFLHHHGPEVRQNLAALSRIGVRIAVDDFGTGYSSIAYLRDLHIDILKADRSFVDRIAQDAGHLRLLKGIVTVAYALEIDVVAEGVETVAQRDLLRKMGCRYAQGFYYSPAVPLDRVSALAADLEGRSR